LRETPVKCGHADSSMFLANRKSARTARSRNCEREKKGEEEEEEEEEEDNLQETKDCRVVSVSHGLLGV
jgi:hypothetical protein